MILISFFWRLLIWILKLKVTSKVLVENAFGDQLLKECAILRGLRDQELVLDLKILIDLVKLLNTRFLKLCSLVVFLDLLLGPLLLPTLLEHVS